MSDRLLRWYPPAWRERYGAELLALLEDTLDGRPPSWRLRLSLLLAGLRERAYAAGLAGSSAPSDVRRRAGTLVVLCAWTAFVFAGAAYARLAEHADLFVSRSAHPVVVWSYTLVQAGALLAGAAVVTGAVVALPALWRYARSGGWPHVRRPILVAATLSGMAAPLTFAVSYDAVALAWVLLGSAAIVAWTVAAVVAARRVTLTAELLRVETALATVVAVSTTATTVSAYVWWRAVATTAPWFLHGAPLAGWPAFAAMPPAAVVALAGAVRAHQA